MNKIKIYYVYLLDHRGEKVICLGPYQSSKQAFFLGNKEKNATPPCCDLQIMKVEFDNKMLIGLIEELEEKSS